MQRHLLPFVTSITPKDLTNFKASTLGSTVILHPNVQINNPSNAYKWKLNGTNLDPMQNNRFIISSADGRLTITSGKLADEGEYQFFISNEFGAMFSNKVGLKFSG